MCILCELTVRGTEPPYSILVDPKTEEVVMTDQETPPDVKTFTFKTKPQAREWYHRRLWERTWASNQEEQARLSQQERGWAKFHAEMRDRIEEEKSELERLLRSDIIRNVSRGVELYGFKITQTREVHRVGSQEPFCSFGGLTAEGMKKALILIAMFELYLEQTHLEGVGEDDEEEEQQQQQQVQRKSVREPPPPPAATPPSTGRAVAPASPRRGLPEGR